MTKVKKIKTFEKKLKDYPEELERTIIIFLKSQRVVSSLYGVYLALQKSRKSKKGLTERESDVLRAMLVFAASGLDSVVKQLVRDTLPVAAEKHLDVQKQMEKYIERRLKTRNTEGADIVDLKSLSAILVAPSTFKRVIGLYIDDLTAGSLQSRDELIRIGSIYAIETQKICDDLEGLKSAFEARNQIIHEMDINLRSGSNRRRPRNSSQMCKFSNLMLGMGSNFIEAVRLKLET